MYIVACLGNSLDLSSALAQDSDELVVDQRVLSGLLNRYNPSSMPTKKKVRKKNARRRAINFAAIAYECDQLRANFPGLSIISFKKTLARECAPTIYRELKDKAAYLADKAGVACPKLYIQLDQGGDVAGLYNASAQKKIKVYTKTTTHEDGSQEKVVDDRTHFRLTVGEWLLKLAYGDEQNHDILLAVMAHEMGHIYHDHTEECIAHEHQADEFAVRLLDFRSEPLIKALNMLSLAHGLLNSYDVFASLGHAGICQVVTDVARAVPGFGALAMACSHVEYGRLIAEGCDYASTHVHDYEGEDVLVASLCDALMIVCMEPTSIVSTNFNYLQAMCCALEDKKPQQERTHPAPFPRNQHILACAA